MAVQADEAPKWKVWAARLLKLLILAFLAGTAIFFFWSCFRYLLAEEKGLDFEARVFFGVFFLFLGVITLLFAFGIWKEAPLRESASPASSSEFAMIDWAPKLRALRATQLADFEESALQQRLRAGDFHSAIDQCEEFLQNDPDDLVVLLYRLCAFVNLGDPRAETELRELAARIPQRHRSIHTGILELRIWDALNRGEVDLLLACLKRLVDSDLPEHKKVSILDAAACKFLYANRCEQWDPAEICARKAAALAPELLTIKGTLGAVLAEKGELAEAEALLSECYHKAVFRHDQGISAYYLARIDEQRGHAPRAREWARLSMELYREPWLITKVEALLKRVGK
jgi:tetratricopeptide (TPR) repeat protein